MKANSSIAIALAFVCAVASSAAARPRPAGHNKRFESNKTFGLGLELGSPLGVNGKYFLSEGGSHAIDFGFGAESYYFHAQYGINTYVDYLWHPLSFVSADAFELPLYFGVGGRFWEFHHDDPAANDQSYAFGVRVPVGVSFDFNDIPLDAFVQAAFVLDLFVDYDVHTIFPDLDVSVGARYWFN
jgi:hypothetical protein